MSNGDQLIPLTERPDKIKQDVKAKFGNSLARLKQHLLLQLIKLQTAKHKDSNNNTFTYRAKIKDAQGAQLNRWVYDVFLDARRTQ